MSGEERLRDGAELYRAAAERSRTGAERDGLLDRAADLAQIADWVAANQKADETAGEAPEHGEAVEARDVYASENGDRWQLAHDAGSRRVFVRHLANIPSGGHVTDIELAEFLSGPRDSPERQALVRLISNLVRGSD